MRKLIKNKKAFIAVLAAVILLAGVAFIYKARKPQAAYAVLSLNFQEASSGLNPDGTPFDANEILSEEVLKAASEKCGVPAETIKENLSVRPSGESAGNTLATDYNLSYTGKSGANVLQAVYDAYDEYFAEKHTVTAKNLSYEDWVSADAEPIDVADHLKNETDRIIKYVNGRIKENSTWTPSDGVSSFQSLKTRAQNIENTDIVNLRTYIEENGVALNIGHLSDTFDYRIKLLQQSKDKSDKAYTVRRDAITLYDSKLFPTVSVPSVSQGQYYISTTKTGLDDIYDAAQYYLDSSLSLEKQIDDSRMVIDAIKTGKSGSSQNADEAIDTIREELKVLVEDVKKTDAEYIEETKEPYFHFTIDRK